ncbi:MAG: hypothetical protein JW747_06715 [Candidatus Aminicenantes bacterium]|nr:hypothetical protein [Candidatus Aminicenantes bacterium]
MRSEWVLWPALFLGAAGALCGSWRTDVADRIQAGDLKGASGMLSETYAELEPADKAEASALLAFLFRKQEDAGRERSFLFEFFVSQGNGQADFNFLGYPTSEEATAYLNAWRVRYPRLSGAWLVVPKGERSSAAPSELVIGLESPVEMLYKFSDESGPVRGGRLHRGWNLIPVDAVRLFDASRTHRYTLDLTSGGVEIRQDLELEVRLSAEPSASAAPKSMDWEYKVTLFAGGREVATSLKTGRDKSPLALDIPEVNLRANPMFKPPSVSDDPFDPSNRGVSIMDAIGVVTGLLQDLLSDKTPPYESAIEKKRSETFAYYAGSERGREERVTAVVTLDLRGAALKDR